MPELPEVETSKNGIRPHIKNKSLKDVIIRQYKLRWPINKNLSKILAGQKLSDITRRGKYLLFDFDTGTLIIHLGMSGSLRICKNNTPHEKHDHLDLVFSNNKTLRLRDPRKFGSVLWTEKAVHEHKLLVKLGPEPLSDVFNNDYLYQLSRKRRCSIKTLIMNSHSVVGVGNIYASESLFLSGIRPTRQAGKITKSECQKLVASIKQILVSAIEQGGTTLKDFVRSDGQPGYFAQQLHVYGRESLNCLICKNIIKKVIQQNRSSFYCNKCQK